MTSIDKDKTVVNSIRQVYNNYSTSHDIYFANGGDQSNKSIPEALICEKLDIKLIDGLGRKIQSSSWLLNNDEN